MKCKCGKSLIKNIDGTDIQLKCTVCGESAWDLLKSGKESPIKVLRDIIYFKEQKDKTYDVILVLQGYQLGHNDKTQCISNQKLLCNIHPDNLDLMVGLYRKCNDNVHIEFLENDGNCDYGVNSPTSFQSEDSSKRFFKPK